MRISSNYIYRAILLVNMFLFFGQNYSYAQFSMGNTLAPLPGNFYPIIYSNDVKGGFHQVATIAERNAIPALRRQLGMVCTVLDAGSGTPVTYQLLGGLLDANWAVFASSAATSGNFADLTNKPTTIAGYGITDATTITGTPNQISASASTGAVTLSLPATITGLTSVTSTEFVGALTGNASTVTTNANLTGEVTSVGNATTVGNAAVIGKVLTGFTSGAGTITATDNILQAIQKLDGNTTAGANATHTGDVTGATTLTIASDAVTTAKILNSNVTYAKIQNVSTSDKVLGRVTAGSGAVEEISTTGSGDVVRATSPTLVAPTLGVATVTSINGLTPTAGATGFTIAGGTTSKTLTVPLDATVSGINTGDQTITLTGDLTGTGTGSFATALSTSGVTAATYGSATQVPVFAVDAKGRVTVVTNTTITGTSPVGSALTSAKILVGSASDMAAAVSMSGDVTISNLGATTITDKAVTLAKMDDMATGSLIYRKTALAGAPEVQSLATLKTDLGLTGINTGDQDLSALATTAATSASLNLKVDKEAGKGLSTNDYTTAEQTKLAAISGTNTGDQVLPTLSSLGAVAGNTAITAGTNTKITYDAKGLVTAGAAATTADIAASADKNYVTDAKLAVLNNTSGANTGDQNLAGLGGVPTTRTVNGHALSSDVTVTASDVSLGNVTNESKATMFTSPTFTGTVSGVTAAMVGAPVGSGTSTGNNTGDQTITLTGDLTGTGTGSFATTLSTSGVTAATYGSATQVPVFAVDAKGRVTGVTNTTITGTSPVGSALTSANILVGSASDQAAAVAMSGDIAIDNTGATTIGATKVTYAKMQTVTASRLLGNPTASASVPSEIFVGSGLSLSTGGELTATGSGGTVTSVAALTLGTTGTDVSSSVATGTTTPVITLNIPTASASNRGALSAADWSTFNKYNQWDGGSTGLTAATGRTSLGATTIGSSIFTLTNPSAVTFLRFNADNTVSALDAATFRSAIGAGTSSASGTVTSVSVTTANGVSGSVATNTTTPAISLTLGAITPTSVAATGTVTGSNLSGTNTGDNAVNSLYSGLTNYTHPTGDGNLHVIATSTTNSGKVLTAGATAGSLSWTTPAAGTVTSVGGTGTVSGLTLTGTVTTSGNLTLGGTLTETDPIVKAINGIVKSNGTTITAAAQGTDYSLVREVAFETLAGAGQTNFYLDPTKPPSPNSKVKMYINGVRISNSAYSTPVMNLITYIPANNGSYTLTAGDRIQFDYYY